MCTEQGENLLMPSISLLETQMNSAIFKKKYESKRINWGKSNGGITPKATRIFIFYQFINLSAENIG